jgi:hypothetical protein
LPIYYQDENYNELADGVSKRSEDVGGASNAEKLEQVSENSVKDNSSYGGKIQIGKTQGLSMNEGIRAQGKFSVILNLLESRQRSHRSTKVSIGTIANPATSITTKC